MLENNEYYLNLARQYLEDGLEDKARRIILTHRTMAPDIADFHVQWAELCAELGMSKQARESYEHAVYLSPDNAEIIYLFATFLHDLGYHEEAIHYLKKAVSKDPGHKKARGLLAEIYLIMGLDGLAGALRPHEPEKVSPLRYFSPSISRGDIERFLDRFVCGERGFAIQKIDNQKGLLTYDFSQSPVTPREVESHLKGEITLAGCPLRPDMTVKFGIIEIRLRKRVMESNLKNTAYLAFLGEKALDHAIALKNLAYLNNIPAYIEDTGDHSHRLWFFFRKSVHFLKVKSFLKRFLKQSDLFDSRFTIGPLLPTRGTGIGWIEEPLFLPLGIHRRTMRRSLFIDEKETKPYGEQLKFLKKIQFIPFSEIFKGFQRYFVPSGSSCEKQLDILTLKLRRKCPIIDALCQKAMQGRSLSHAEKIILFYSIGLVDIDGLSMHRLLETTPDYQYEKVEKQRLRLKPNPISCLKIRELIPEITAEVLCCCSFDLKTGHYPSPLLHINPNLVPTNKDLVIPDRMPVREAAKRYILINDQIMELEKVRGKISALLDRNYEATGIDRIDIGSKALCRREIDQTWKWRLEFRT